MNLLKKIIIKGAEIKPGMDIINPHSGGIVTVLSVTPPVTGSAYHLNTTGGRLLFFGDDLLLKVAK